MSDVLTITELVKADSVRHDVDAGSRKRLFQIIAEASVDPAAIDKEEAVDEIYDALVERERLVAPPGDGVAIHCRGFRGAFRAFIHWLNPSKRGRRKPARFRVVDGR